MADEEKGDTRSSSSSSKRRAFRVTSSISYFPKRARISISQDYRSNCSSNNNANVDSERLLSSGHDRLTQLLAQWAILHAHNWISCVAEATWQLNSTASTDTISPYQLVFGMKPGPQTQAVKKEPVSDQEEDEINIADALADADAKTVSSYNTLLNLGQAKS